MAWAIFHAPFVFDRRPNQAVSFHIQPSPEPRSLPHDVIDAAVAAGKATRVRPKRQSRKTVSDRRNPK